MKTQDLDLKEVAKAKMHVEISEREPNAIMDWKEGRKAAKREMYSDSSVARFSHPH